MLIQVLVKSADLSSGKVRVAVPFYAMCDVNVLGFSYCDTDNSNHTHIIQLRSNELILTNSPVPNLTFIVQSGSNNIMLSDGHLHLKDIILNGVITLEPINVATGATPANFSALILTLDVIPKK